MAPPVVDQEFVVHLFARLGGPGAAESYQEVQRIWAACRETLRMTERIPGLLAPTLPPRQLGDLPADGVAAGQESVDTDRQSVLRRVHDVLSLSMMLAQPVPEGLPSRPGGHLTPVRPPGRRSDQRRLGWADFAQIWAQAHGPGPAALLGEARLFLARTPSGSGGVVEATPEFGRSLDPLLPYRDDRPREWWRWGTTTAGGYALWDTWRTADGSGVREIVLVAAADQDETLSTWAWSDGTPSLPPFARYLMHAAKLRFEARLLDTWHGRPSEDDLDEVLAELPAVVLAEDARPGDAALLRTRVSRLEAEEIRLANLRAELESLRRTVSIARSNMTAVPGCEARHGAGGIFAADQELAQWLTDQVDDDLAYLDIDLGRTSRVRSVAAEALAKAGSRAPEPAASGTGGASGAGNAFGAGDASGSMATRATASGYPAGETDQQAAAELARRVFIVHGRDGQLAGRFRDLLSAADLRPLEWETLVEANGSAAPYLGQLVAEAPHLAQATLVLLSPDDVVQLHADLYQDNDLPHERVRAAQARPNVLFELGLALMAYPDRTVVVEVGRMRPVADLAGLNVIRFDGSAPAIKKVLDRLRTAGCPVDYSGAWLDAARFAGLPAYERGPGTHDEDG